MQGLVTFANMLSECSPMISEPGTEMMGISANRSVSIVQGAIALGLGEVTYLPILHLIRSVTSEFYILFNYVLTIKRSVLYKKSTVTDRYV